LLELNRLAGRSFSCATHYPVFPWVWNDYSSPTVDLTSIPHFRPLGMALGGIEDFAMEPPDKISSARTIVEFLYGSQMIDSIPMLWEAVDFRELPPEFFYFPEILFTPDCALPQWARSTFDICYQNRRTLESEFVSQNLHLWINIIFGICRFFARFSSAILFDTPHPARAERVASTVKRWTMCLPDRGFIFASIFELREKSFRLMTVDSRCRFCVRLILPRDGDWYSDQIVSVIPDIEKTLTGITFSRVSNSLLLTDSCASHFNGEKLISLPFCATLAVADGN
jgi:hypothetical protein